MKNLIADIFTTTGISLVVLSIFVRFLIPGYDLFFSTIVFQTFGANIVIHLGLLVTRKFESTYLAVEVFLDILYTTAVLAVFGWIFGWFRVVSLWVLVVIAVLIHVLALLINMARMRETANDINKLLKSRKNKQSKKGSMTDEL